MSVSKSLAQQLELSRLDKVLFPEAGFTKGKLIDYYHRIAPLMLPHIQGRPLTLHRFPDGIGKQGFFQQSRSDYFPDWLEGAAINHGGDTGTIEHIIAGDARALAYLAGQGTICLHRWLSREPDWHSPDQMIFDLDPPGDNFEPVRQAARQVREQLTAAGLTPYVMTTGSRGLHVVAPLRPDAEFDRVREVARTLAQQLAEQYPETLTTEQRKNKRRGRLYLDVMRNAFGQTAVAPYAVRALPHAPIATPLNWSELNRGELHPRRYHLRNIHRRLSHKRDPWADIMKHAVALSSLRL